MTFTAGELRHRDIDPKAVKLRRWRRDHCMTVAEFAAVLGVGAKSLGRVETGVRRLPKRWHERIAALYARWDRVTLSPRASARLERKRVEAELAKRQMWLPYVPGGEVVADAPEGAMSG